MKPREEIANILQFIRDSLTAAQLFHGIEQSPERSDLHEIVCYDDEERINAALIGWDDVEKTVRYYAYDPVRANHNEAEGIDGPDAEWAWETGSAEMLLLHLKGEVRRIQAKYRRLVREAEEKELRGLELDSGE